MKKKQAVETSRKLMQDEEFKGRHRSSRIAFTRTRKLPFSIVIVLILRKSLKSLQLRLNELMLSFDSDDTVTNSAFTQARANLHHTAFIELNQKAVADVMYGDDNIKLYKGMRVLGIDGSKVLLPDTPDIINEFDQISYSNARFWSQVCSTRWNFQTGIFCIFITCVGEQKGFTAFSKPASILKIFPAKQRNRFIRTFICDHVFKRA